MVNFRKILLGGLCVAFLLGKASVAFAYEEGDWLFSPHIGGSPAYFNTPFGLTATITDDPELPDPVIVSPNEDQDSPAASIRCSGTANYNKLYRTPFVFGLDIGYMASPCLEVFFGYEYMRARGKKFNILSKTLNNIKYALTAELKSYDAHIGYVGVRRYYDITPCFSTFIGLKLGGSQNKQGITHLELKNGAKIDGSSKFDTPGFFNTIGFVGGPQLGFDYRVTECTSLFISGEALYKTSHYADTRPARFVPASPTAPKMQSQVTQFGTSLWAFPFTVGVRILR